MSIKIGDTLLKYKINEVDNYIITYVNDFDEELDMFLNKLYHHIHRHYKDKKINYSNMCGSNTEFICNYFNALHIDGLKLGKIIITDWDVNKTMLDNIETVYGIKGTTIGSSYHALVYLEVSKFYVAIETTKEKSCRYNLQFYVGSSIKEFERIIKARYQCSNFKISFDCNQDWINIAYPENASSSSNTSSSNSSKKKAIRKVDILLNEKDDTRKATIIAKIKSLGYLVKILALLDERIKDPFFLSRKTELLNVIYKILSRIADILLNEKDDTNMATIIAKIKSLGYIDKIYSEFRNHTHALK